MKKHMLFSLITGLVLATQAAHAAAPRAEDLIEAVQTDNAAEVQRLIAAGANVNAQGEHGFTALIWAAQNGYMDVVRALLAAEGIEVNVQEGHTGSTALMFAALRGHYNTVQALLDAGADPIITNNLGQTAADLAKTDEIRAMLTEPRTKAAGKR